MKWSDRKPMGTRDTGSAPESGDRGVHSGLFVRWFHQSCLTSGCRFRAPLFKPSNPGLLSQTISWISSDQPRFHTSKSRANHVNSYAARNELTTRCSSCASCISGCIRGFFSLFQSPAGFRMARKTAYEEHSGKPLLTMTGCPVPSPCRHSQ